MSSLIALASKACRKNRISIQHDHYLPQIYPKLFLEINKFDWDRVLYYACKYNLPLYIDQAISKGGSYYLGAHGAYRGGKLDLLNRMVNHIDLTETFIHSYFTGAGKHKYIDCINRAKELGIFEDPSDEFLQAELAAGNLIPMDDLMFDRPLKHVSPFENACKYGHLSLVQRMVEAGLEYIPATRTEVIGFKAACGSKSVHRMAIVLFLMDRFDLRSKYDSGFKAACRRGNMDVILHLEPIVNGYAFVAGFCNACEHGRMDLVHWFHQHHSNKISYMHGFEKACKSNNVSVVEFFFQLKYKVRPKGHVLYLYLLDYNESLVFNLGFNQACQHGYVPIVQYLVFQLKCLQLDQLICPTSSLIDACAFGRADMAQYFISLGVIISMMLIRPFA